jgi:pentatricopeptide repeat protein
MGEKIHFEALRMELLGKSIILGNAIMDMYVKCSMLEKGREVFEHELTEKDTASWNTMINGYSQHGLDCEALGLFPRMQEENLSLAPNAVTSVSVLKACGSSGALEMGEGIHAEVRKKGRVLGTNAILGNAIAAKCGMLGDAWRVFDKLPIRNVASWNTLITGYAQHGYPKMAFHLFVEMNAHNVDPDLITFLILLNVCSHSGLVDDGRVVLDAMHHIYRLPPTREHYACMVGLFSRSGCFEKALLETEKVLDFERLPLWWSLLGASSEWRNVEVGKWAFERSLEVDRKCADTYNMPEEYICSCRYAR